LESKVAKYPRIVIGDELESFVKGMKDFESDGEEAEFVRERAIACEKLIGEDLDGVSILDFMGEGALMLMKEDDTLRAKYVATFPGIRSFFEEQKQKWESDEETGRSKKEKKELVRRYQCAIDYYESRIHLWEG